MPSAWMFLGLFVAVWLLVSTASALLSGWTLLGRTFPALAAARQDDVT